MTRKAVEKHYIVYEKALAIFTDRNRTESAQYNDMQRYLGDAVREGAISKRDRFEIIAEILDVIWGPLEMRD